MFVGAPISNRKKRIPATQTCKNEEDLNIMNQIRANTNQIWVQNHEIWIQIEASLKQIWADLGLKAFIFGFGSIKLEPLLIWVDLEWGWLWLLMWWLVCYEFFWILVLLWVWLGFF